MKTSPTSGPFLTLLAASTLLAVSSSHAAILTWDITNNGAAIDPGDGTWNTTAGNVVWNNAGTNVVWAAANEAVFGGADGTYAITVGASFSAQKILFSNSGYTLSSAAARTITLTAPGGTGVQPGLALAAGVSATVGSNITIGGNSTTYIGADNGTASGTLTIEGTGATVRSLNTGSSIVLDGVGTTVNVKTGGLFANAPTTPTGSVAVGQFASSDATLNVDGGSVLVGNTGTLQIGNLGKGTVNLNSGTITVGTASTGGVTFGVNVNNASSNLLNLNGGILTTPLVRKVGAGSTATLNLNGGTLVANASKTNFMEGLDAANIKAGGVVIDTQAFNIRIAQALLNDGTGGLTKNGTGSLTLAGINTYTGATTVSNGTLLLSTDGSSASDVTVSSGTSGGVLIAAVEGQHASTGDLILSNTSTLLLDYGINDPLQSRAPLKVDNFSVGTGITLLLRGTVFPATVYPLVTWTTNGPADGSGFNQVVVNGLPGTISVDAATKTMSVTFSQPTPISWNTGNGTWDAATSNWVDQALAATTFTNSDDAVLFGDAAGATGNPVVTLDSTFSPLGVLMNSTSHDYTISGSGTIGGLAGLTLEALNTRLLTLTTANTYTGETKVLGGTLSLGDGGANGSLAPTSAISVDSPASFIVNQSDTVTQGVDFGVISGLGSFTQAGPGITVLNVSNPFTGPTSVTNGTLQIAATGRLGGGTYPGDISLTEASSVFQYGGTATQTLSGIISGPGSLIKSSGSGSLTLSGGNTYSGSTSVSGTLNLASTTCLATTNSITMTDGTSILRPTVEAVTITAPITLGGSGVTARIYAPTPGTPGQVTTTILNGAILGTGNVRFFGASSVANTNATILLNAQSTYTGNTELDTAGTADHFAGVNLFVKNGIENALPVTTVLSLDGDVGRGSGRTVAYDLSGFDQTLAGLTNVTTGTSLRVQRVTNTGTPATLTIRNSTNYSFGSTLDTVVSTSTLPSTKIAGNINLTKAGAGTFTLVGIHQYNGNTTVTEGILSLSAPNTFNEASTVTIAASGATLDLNFTGTESVLNLVIGNVPQANGVYGAVGSALPVIGIPQITGTGTLTVAPVATGYAAWKGTNAGGQAPELDFDQDGVANGVEYFMNAPAGFTANPELNASNTITWPNGGRIPAAAYGTQFVVQTSSDLTAWTDVLGGDLVSNTDGPAGSLSYTLTGAAPRFVRLKVRPE